MNRIRNVTDHGMHFRITHWPEPMPAGPSLPIRKALAAMSVGWVTRRCLERETRLRPEQVQALLDELEAQGALTCSNEVPDIEPVAEVTVGSAARALLGRVSRRIVDATLSRYSWWADDAQDLGSAQSLLLPYTTLPVPEDTRPAP